MKLAVSPEITRAWAGGLSIDDFDGRQCRQVLDKFDALGLSGYLADTGPGHEGVFALSPDAAQRLIGGADGDTMHLCRELGLDTMGSTPDLEREIVLAMLAAPRPLRFPSAFEFLSAVAIRRNIVVAARRTQLAFGTAMPTARQHTGPTTKTAASPCCPASR